MTFHIPTRYSFTFPLNISLFAYYTPSVTFSVVYCTYIPYPKLYCTVYEPLRISIKSTYTLFTNFHISTRYSYTFTLSISRSASYIPSRYSYIWALYVPLPPICTSHPVLCHTQLGGGGRCCCCSGGGWDMTGGGWETPVFYFYFYCFLFLLFFFWCFRFRGIGRPRILGEILHIGCSSIAAWIYIFGGAGQGFEPGTALQQSGVLTSWPRLTPLKIDVCFITQPVPLFIITEPD
jgi:hypothetical protein